MLRGRMRTYKVIRGPHFDADTKMVVTDSYYEQLHHLISCKEKNNVILADYLQTALCFFFHMKRVHSLAEKL